MKSGPLVGCRVSIAVITDLRSIFAPVAWSIVIR
jgi:hypothetical protein